MRLRSVTELSSRRCPQRSHVLAAPAPAPSLTRSAFLSQRLRDDAAGSRPVCGSLGEQRQDQRFELVRDERVARLRPVGRRGIMLRHDRRRTAR